MQNTICKEMREGEVLNETSSFPLYHAVIYGNKVDTAKLSKRVSCAIKHLPIRVKFSFVYDSLKAVEKGISKDPTMLVDDEIFIEGLIQSEEITKKFEELLKGK